MIFLKLIAHRGLRTSNIKENTIEAFQNAIQNEKVAGFEFDIRKTKDNHFVIHHNAFVESTLIYKENYKELKKNYSLPLLREALNLETDKLMLVEIKDTDISYEKLMKILNAFSTKNIYVMSFHNKVIAKLKELGCKQKLGILNYVLNSEENYPYDFICLLNNFATKNLVEEYQKRGIEVFLYGVLNEKKDLKIENAYYIVDRIE